MNPTIEERVTALEKELAELRKLTPAGVDVKPKAGQPSRRMRVMLKKAPPRPNGIAQIVSAMSHGCMSETRPVFDDSQARVHQQSVRRTVRCEAHNGQ